MSHKVTTFAAGCPGPKTIDRFQVFIPGVINSPLRVSSTAYPQQNRSVIKLSVSGQPVFLPGKSQVPGAWTCILEESQLEDAATQIQLLKKRVQTDGHRVQEYSLIEPIIFITDQSTGLIPTYFCTLKGAWLSSIDPLQLDWSQPGTPIKWKLTFQYSWIDRSYLDENK